jgi:hypothetical protein
MASKNNKKKPTTTSNFATLSPKQYLKQRARKLPIVKTFINSDFLTTGLACVVIVRQQGGEKYLLGTFMVDIFCLGIKNSLFEMGLPEYALDDHIEDYYAKKGLSYQKYDPNYAQNVIWGAFEYAEELGFAPTKYSDFDVTQYILDPIEEIEFVDIPFGQNGKPFFIAGPHDNVQKVTNILTKKVGEGNFNFLHPMGNMLDLNNFDFDYDDDDDESETYDTYEEIS